MKPIFHFNIEQGSDEWFALRAGKITGSVAKTFLVKGKGIGGFGAGAITEMYKMIEEILTGVPRESFKGNNATDWGKFYEDEAIEYYEMRHFIKTTKVGFVQRDSFTGASPDRVIPAMKKGVEAKCLPKEHMRIFDTKEYDKNHYLQCQFNLWCSGYKSWDLIYYHPNLPDKLKLVEFNFIPDKVLFLTFEKRTAEFKEIVDQKIMTYSL